jgi:hypothetical protein
MYDFNACLRFKIQLIFPGLSLVNLFQLLNMYDFKLCSGLFVSLIKAS